jgi:hypothetical protein
MRKPTPRYRDPTLAQCKKKAKEIVDALKKAGMNASIHPDAPWVYVEIFDAKTKTQYCMRVD